MASNTSSKESRRKDTISGAAPIDRATILLDLIMARRSVRFFRRTRIPEDHLKMILESARWAPSPANAQPWEFFVVKDRRVKRDLMDMMKKVGKAVRDKYAEFPWGKTSHDPELISEVAVIIAVCANFDREELGKYDLFPPEYKNELVGNSIGAAVQNMMLTATVLGVGSLWVSLVSSDEIKKLLRIPKALHLVALVALGYPARGRVEKTERRPLDTMVHYVKPN